jgi:hypothetical protein
MMYPYEFTDCVAYYAFDRYAYTVLFLPSELQANLPFKKFPRLRIEGEINDWPVQGAWQPAGDGKYYLILSKRFLKEAGLAAGSFVSMRFCIADQNAVDVPAELALSIKKNKTFAKAWEKLTPGTQRAFSHRVASAKAESTRHRRLLEVIDMVLSKQKPGRPKTR